MDTNNKYLAVLLSILSNPLLYYVWEHFWSESPLTIYKKICAEQELSLQYFITEHYSADPEVAAAMILESCVTKGIHIIDIWDDDYPVILKQIPRPPIVLYVTGTFPVLQKIAIVGSRNADQRSKSVAKRLSMELARYGYTIVSGMAIGIDRESHIGALEGGGSTVGVLANGINVLYPAANIDLFRQIEKSERSALVSEYPPGVIAGKWTFVRRNRIISGLSLGTVVVKAGIKSGALITAKYALEQNREVFACPGVPFSDENSGCNDLIRKGAVLVTRTEDILEELSRITMVTRGPQSTKRSDCGNRTDNFFSEKKEQFDENAIESKVIRLLSSGEMHVDEIIHALNMPVAQVQQTLIGMELAGAIVRIGNQISKLW